MAYEIPAFSFTLPAAADHSANQYLFCTCNSSGQAAVAGAGVTAIGVIQNKPTSGKATEIFSAPGISKVRAGAAVAVGAKVMANASGQGITATSTNQGLGIALTAAANANEVISVKLMDLGTI